MRIFERNSKDEKFYPKFSVNLAKFSHIFEGQPLKNLLKFDIRYWKFWVKFFIFRISFKNSHPFLTIFWPVFRAILVIFGSKSQFWSKFRTKLGLKVDLENFPRSQFCLNFSRMFVRPIFVLKLHIYDFYFQIIEKCPEENCSSCGSLGLGVSLSVGIWGCGLGG